MFDIAVVAAVVAVTMLLLLFDFAVVAVVTLMLLFDFVAVALLLLLLLSLLLLRCCYGVVAIGFPAVVAILAAAIAAAVASCQSTVTNNTASVVI